MSLKEQLQMVFNLPDSSFGSYCSDLYVLHNPEVYQWLRDNYEFFKNVKVFTGAKGSDWSGKMALDIPFANEKYFTNRR